MKIQKSKSTDLSAEKRRLFERVLRQKGLARYRAPGIPTRPDDASPPLSFAQQRLWFFDQLVPGDPAYNDSYAIRMRGTLEAGLVGRALSDIVRRHEALRTSFVIDGAGPVQVVAPPSDVPLPVEPLDELRGDEADGAIQRAILKLAGEPFDLSTGPLLRARLLRFSERDHVLLLVIHHIVSDGASYCILFKELADTYGALARGEDPPLAAPCIQFADYAAWERARLTEGSMAPHLAYWRETLAGPPPKIELDTDRPRPDVQSFRGAGEAWALPREVARSVIEAGRRHDATLFAVLHAAFQVLLHHRTGLDDICCGFAMSTRDAPETQGLIGFFVNTLALRVDLSGDPSFAEVVARTRLASLEAFEHKDVPFERLVQELELPRSLDQNPLFQVFAVQYSHPRPIELPDLTLSYCHVDYGVTRFDLEMWITDDTGLAPGADASEPGAGELAVNFQYNRDLFDKETIDRLVRQFETLVTHGVRDDGLTVSALCSRIAEADAEGRESDNARRRRGALEKLRRARRTRVVGTPDGKAGR